MTKSTLFFDIQQILYEQRKLGSIKNLQRRIYEVLNIFSSMNIIYRDRNLVSWRGVFLKDIDF